MMSLILCPLSLLLFTLPKTTKEKKLNSSGAAGSLSGVTVSVMCVMCGDAAAVLYVRSCPGLTSRGTVWSEQVSLYEPFHNIWLVPLWSGSATVDGQHCGRLADAGKRLY